ncbi:integrase/recombinase, phage integrase family protein [Streptococcus pneumoniae]|nr:integrase/recombinase, phage integrase family protein [Streptococcus pneumoniae]VOO78870.1 integrase/recombinase, phage integrase family protein [Streptococcus pneumoniae]VPM42349.1 integrase/recombinase, phage integrase family protein [Streptococcus pneumoniae]
MESKVTIIMQEMLPLLNNEQLLALREFRTSSSRRKKAAEVFE